MSTFQQHKDIVQYILFDTLEFWKSWPRIFSLITTTHVMMFKLGAVVYTCQQHKHTAQDLLFKILALGKKPSPATTNAIDKT